ncbi:betaine-homocysteine S-methyltransferase [Fistulifera solaris]|uniref:Betaine-homocysteine S-methyltransferase n=1 Tax=Fistulifera solaris TaxID=1519565 RepID=A0A1Z5JMG0_FISSO|nr:betaine-homocysteine S-methyltransferase [Fistulifera solaris]|eukprot:GAX15200.1 betaine-homocysteine S-methyltransferase [Fistulifera solaris]
MTSLEECIQHNVPFFWLDGGTGEELFRRNVPDDRKLWSATAVVHAEYHETLRAVHRSFLEAGADAITTNTYGLVPSVGFSVDEISQYCELAARLARQVVQETRAEAWVFGSLGPLVESYRPDLIRTHEEGVSLYQSMITAMASHIDAVLAETMSSVEEAMQAVDALALYNTEQKKELPMLVSFTLQANGNVRSHEPAECAIGRILQYAREKHVRVLAVLFNCCAPEAISIALQRVHKTSSARSCVLGAYPNRLTEISPDWTMAESSGPQPFRADLDVHHYAQLVQSWRDQYPLLRIVGGCCGITPEHIAYLKQVIVE